MCGMGSEPAFTELQERAERSGFLDTLEFLEEGIAIFDARESLVAWTLRFASMTERSCRTGMPLAEFYTPGQTDRTLPSGRRIRMRLHRTSGRQNLIVSDV